MILETNRCTIKPVGIEDKTDLHRLCDDPNVWQYLGGQATAEHNRKNIDYIGKVPITDRWVVRGKADDSFLGAISLIPHHAGDDLEVSYLFLSKHWGKGYASEVVTAVIHYAFSEKKINRLLAETQSANLASCRMLEKLGFHKIKNLVRFEAEQALYAIDNPAG